MDIQLTTQPLPQVEADWLIVGVPEARDANAPLQALDEALSGRLTRLRESGDVTGKHCEIIELRDPDGIAADRLLLVGLGGDDSQNLAGAEKALMSAVRRVSARQHDHVALSVPVSGSNAFSENQAVQLCATVLQVGCVGQGLYRTEPERFQFQRATVVASADDPALRTVVERGRIEGEAVNLARELVNRHAGELYPETFARRAEQIANECSLQYDVLDESRLAAENMRALLAVGRGSARPPRVVVVEHRGGGADGPLLGLCGKGVTFDSGGLSLKTNDGMKTMKADMAGAATVLAVMSAVARLKLPVNVIGVMGLVENMPGGDSYKLGDILTARNGVTIEVLNTDAEGRLVLSDVLAYTVDRGAQRLIDLATLTGSCVVALGEEITGVFSNNQPWCDEFKAAAARAGEPVWQMPMFDSFDEQLKSEVADTKNVGTRWGGSITAAKFLQKFVADSPWVHLDIAGPAFANDSKPHREGGGSGCMVRTLVELLTVQA